MVIAKRLVNYFQKLNAMCTNRVEEHGAQYELFGIFAVVNYIIPYFQWSPSQHNNYEMLIAMRFVAGILCFLLIIKDYWIKSLADYLPLYWHFTLLYCLPFLTTFMLFDSRGNSFWLLNAILALLLLAVLVDWRSFIVILMLGVLSGYALFAAMGEFEKFSLSTETVYWTTYMCFFSVIIGILFSRRNEKIASEKLNAYKDASTSIAHEMRTPLSSMYISAQGMQDFLPRLLEAYNIAEKNGLKIPRVEKQKLELLREFPSHLISISRRSLSIIDIFLTKFSAFEKSIFPESEISIAECISRAVNEYPFYSDSQKSQVSLLYNTDFKCLADGYLMIHVFSNLIKNSLYQIQVENRGEISIWFSDTAEFNVVHFKDTATGISQAELPKVFEKFYSGNSHGTGIGLAYCRRVMNSLGGKILCRSRFGEFTEFELYFPKIGVAKRQVK